MGTQLPPRKGTRSRRPHFSAHFALGRSLISATAELLLTLSHSLSAMYMATDRATHVSSLPRFPAFSAPPRVLFPLFSHLNSPRFQSFYSSLSFPLFIYLRPWIHSERISKSICFNLFYATAPLFRRQPCWP